MKRLVFISASILFFAAVRADDPLPGAGFKAAEEEEKQKEQEKGQKAEVITILGKRMLPDAELVGAYGQPAWTAARRFPVTRVYVVPAGVFAVEYWLRADGVLDADRRARFRSLYELEFGLGHRLQLDLYLETHQAEGYAPLELAKEKIELRYALADWGKIFANPTLYLEWIRNHQGPQALEGKLLFGDSFSERWFWGLNLVFERQLGADCEHEYAVSFGLAHSLVDGVFSVGLEGRAALVDAQGSRFDFSEKQFLAGPSFQLKPIFGVHIDLLAMFGAKFSDQTEAVYSVYFIVGKELGSW